MAKNVQDLTCAEAAKIFKQWARDSHYRENAACLSAQAQILKMFGDQKIPTTKSITSSGSWNSSKGK